jgi:hypothetical protein
LWWTGDGGKSWGEFGEDPDRRSPMLVSVDHEGLYGFWLVIEDAAGMRGAAPREGDLPQTWVGVDMTSPAARFLTAETTHASRGEVLTIRWEASDANLSARPVTLAYGAGSDGPWTTLASGLENNGVYVCPLTESLPQSMHLRLTVRDDAGNTQVVNTADAISLARTPIVGGRWPVTGDTARSPRWYQVLR